MANSRGSMKRGHIPTNDNKHQLSQSQLTHLLFTSISLDLVEKNYSKQKQLSQFFLAKKAAIKNVLTL